MKMLLQIILVVVLALFFTYSGVTVIQYLGIRGSKWFIGAAVLGTIAASFLVRAFLAPGAMGKKQDDAGTNRSKML